VGNWHLFLALFYTFLILGFANDFSLMCDETRWWEVRDSALRRNWEFSLVLIRYLAA